MALSNHPLRPKLVHKLLLHLRMMVVIMLISQAESRPDPSSRHLMKLVTEPATILTYHNGPILSGSGSTPVYLLWYGNFSEPQKSIVRDFFSSFHSPLPTNPSVSSWWKPTNGYTDASGSSIPSEIHLAAELSDIDYSKGKYLENADLEELIVGSVADAFPANPHGFYFVITAEDVGVEDFCRNSCGSHFATKPVAATSDRQLPFGWVGKADEGKQCAGRCAWPFANSQYGPQTAPLLAPNGDVGMDGVIMNVAAILAGAFSNPFGNGYYQGDAAAPLEAATACSGTFGPGAYPGYPGQLFQDVITGISFNAFGVNDRRFLLPALWDPVTLRCAYPA